MIIDKEELRTWAPIGIAFAVAVGIGSTIANVYTAAHRAADAYGGWADAGIEGWLNIGLNGALALGSEGLGFVSLGFALSALFDLKHRWVQCLASGAIFIVALIVNMTNTEDFMMEQAGSAARNAAHATPAYKTARADAEKAQQALDAMRDGESEGAVDEIITGLERDRSAAVTDLRWSDAKRLGGSINAARDRKAAARSRADAKATKRDELADAQRRMANIDGRATPADDAEARAQQTKYAIEITKALGLLAFMQGATTYTHAAQSRLQPRPAAKPAEPIERAPAPRKPARASSGTLTLEQRRARQRDYTRKWRALQRAGVTVREESFANA